MELIKLYENIPINDGFIKLSHKKANKLKGSSFKTRETEL